MMIDIVFAFAIGSLLGFALCDYLWFRYHKGFIEELEKKVSVSSQEYGEKKSEQKIRW